MISLIYCKMVQYSWNRDNCVKQSKIMLIHLVDSIQKSLKIEQNLLVPIVVVIGKEELESSKRKISIEILFRKRGSETEFLDYLRE
jgi:hypothetical protein